MRGAGLGGLAVLLVSGAAQAQVMALPTVIRPEALPRRGVEETLPVARDGHFYAAAAVNGAPMRLMVDTGASLVVLRAEDAERVGIDPAGLSYRGTAQTANGRARVAPVVLPAVTVGGITRRNIPALVAEPGRLGVNLLGQSFLARLAGYRQEGGRLVLLGGE